MTITVGTDVYIDHGNAYSYQDNHGNSVWTDKYMVVSSIVSHTDGIKVTTVGVHGLEVADSMTTVDTVSYNGTKPVVTVIDTFNFTLAFTYISDESSGYIGTEVNVKAIEVSLRKATEWIDNHPKHKGNWKGTITSVSQLLSHPRNGLYDEEGRTITSSTIATEVEYSCCEMANKIIEDTEDIFPDLSADSLNLKKKKIDVIEKEWFTSSTSSLRKKYDYVDSLLSGLLLVNSDSKVQFLSRTY